MGVIVKKCRTCGTINQYMARECKECKGHDLYEVDQDDEIMSIDPMEAAVNDVVASVEIGDHLVVKILREQAEAAKKIVAEENAKEERKRKRAERRKKENMQFGGGPDAVSGSGKYGFSIHNDSSGSSGSGGKKKPYKQAQGTTYGGLDGTEEQASSAYGFKIASDDDPVISKPNSASDESSATWSRSSNQTRKKHSKADSETKDDKYKIRNAD